MSKVAVILSGCGYIDGAEIRESVLSLLYLDQQGAEVECFAPDENQMHVVNHLNGEETSEQRNILVESARIARGQIKQLSECDAEAFDALVIPGGFGVAKNLSDFAVKGLEATVNADFERIVKAFAKAKKPIGAICIAPAIIAAVLGKEYQPTVTIGDDADTAAAIESCGATHQNCATDDFVFDAENNIASCCAYMREDPIRHIASGIEKVITKVLERA